MAERRMFSKIIIDSDLFLDMPITARLLYYDLNMRADDDGFINNPKKIARMTGASEDDLKILITKRFIIPFESGVVVIKHWRIHNYLRKDTYKETIYKDEKNQLNVTNTKEYELSDNTLPMRIQHVDNPSTQVREGKVSKDNIYIVEIINYLNQVANKNFKATTPSTKKHISARLKEGFTLEDFKRVVNTKTSQWKNDDKMKQYLRPETLFGTKFESYLNEYNPSASRPVTPKKSYQLELREQLEREMEDARRKALENNSKT